MQDDEQSQHHETPLGPRGGNSSMSIPPGVSLDDGYATDDWPMDTPQEQKPDPDPSESDSDG